MSCDVFEVILCEFSTRRAALLSEKNFIYLGLNLLALVKNLAALSIAISST